MPSWCSTVAWKQTPSLPDARLRADVFRRGDRESKFLAVGTGYGTGAPAYDVFRVKFFCSPVFFLSVVWVSGLWVMRGQFRMG